MNEWSSATLSRIASEATWDRATYERMVKEWQRDAAQGRRKPGPSRKRSHGAASGHTWSWLAA